MVKEERETISLAVFAGILFPFPRVSALPVEKLGVGGLSFLLLAK